MRRKQVSNILNTILNIGFAIVKKILYIIAWVLVGFLAFVIEGMVLGINNTSDNDIDINNNYQLVNYYNSAQEMYSDLLTQYSYTLETSDKIDIEYKIDEIMEIIEELQNNIDEMNNDKNKNLTPSIVTGACTIIASIISLLGGLVIGKKSSKKNPTVKTILLESLTDHVKMELIKVPSRAKFIEEDKIIYVNDIKYMYNIKYENE